MSEYDFSLCERNWSLARYLDFPLPSSTSMSPPRFDEEMSDPIPSSTPPAKRSVRTPASSPASRRKRQKLSWVENTPTATTVNYKSPDYVRELMARGVYQSDGKPTEYHMMVAQLEKRPAHWQDLPSRTLDSFDVIIQSIGNKGSIQGGIVPLLMDYIGLLLNPETLAVMDIPFEQCQLPIQFDCKNIPAPYPDVSVGLHRSQFMDYIPALHHLDDIASPISRTPDLIFPCFALKAKGNSGSIMDVETQNRHNTANMLFNLRQLSVLANGEEATHRSFDRTIKAYSATVSQQALTIFSHWVEQNEDRQGLTFYSYPVKSVAFGGCGSYEDWNRAAMYLQNAISFTVQKTISQVKEDLPRLNKEILRQIHGQPTQPTTTPSSPKSSQ
ncbi:hypothetical protein N7516_008556 [Penicillium verrucosum]|uniref:uncharacterized protein n=1 Tax=Penicillium verrucosum TaxID=60171 RepID=UPI0025458336|nr:uncharacterized protein N7516_008556 [Penicillium verrucosum]KAJ5926783.1 hypothetical protein N7516_008556 [Penicillium verrucosum]